jgi:hypothetical protein
VIVTESLPPGARVPPEGLAKAIPEVSADHVIEVPPRFDTEMAVVEGEVQLPASTLVGVTLSAAGEGVAVGRGVAVRVGDGVAVGFGVGLAVGVPNGGVAVGDVVGDVSTAVAFGCS